MEFDRRSFLKTAVAFAVTATKALDAGWIPKDQVERVTQARDQAVAMVEAFQPGVHFRGGSLGFNGDANIDPDQIRRHPITGAAIGEGPLEKGTPQPW